MRSLTAIAFGLAVVGLATLVAAATGVATWLLIVVIGFVAGIAWATWQLRSHS